jgi:hypothetical protein
VTTSRYLILGHTLETEIDLSEHLLPSHDAADLCLSISPHIGAPSGAAQLIFASSARLPNGEPRIEIWHQNDVYHVRFVGQADFVISANLITACAYPGSSHRVLMNHFLSAVISLWLELRGIPVLHGAAVVHQGQAAAFLANSGQGKSSLATELVLSGCALLSDDLIALRQQTQRYWCEPGFPTMRHWSVSAHYFFGSQMAEAGPVSEKLMLPIDEIRSSAYCRVPVPLGRIYLPQRRPVGDTRTTIEITPLSLRDALIQLMRYIFIAPVLHAVGLAEARLDFSSEMVKSVTVCQLIYPDGYRHLPAVRQAVLQDLDIAHQTTEEI